MAAIFSELIIDAHDLDGLAEFWQQVLGYDVLGRTEGRYVEIGKNGRMPTLVFVPVPEKKTVKNRLHIDVNPVDRDQMEEVDRILALGATRADVGQGDDVSWVVLADPEGNEFCVLRERRPDVS